MDLLDFGIFFGWWEMSLRNLAQGGALHCAEDLCRCGVNS